MQSRQMQHSVIYSKVAPDSKRKATWLYVFYAASILRMLCWGCLVVPSVIKVRFLHSEQLHLWASRTLLRAERMLKSLSSTASLHGTKLLLPFAAKHFPATGYTRPGSDGGNSPTLSL